MKTAGTPLRLILEDDLGAEAVYANARDLSRREHGWYPTAKGVLAGLPMLRRHAAIIGHFPATILERLPGEYKGAVLVRPPLQRSLSALTHMARLKATTPPRLEDDEEIIRRLVLDYQTKIFGFPSIECPNSRDQIDDLTLDRALCRISELPFVGVAERFSDSCRLFDEAFGTGTAQYGRQLNVLRDPDKEHVDLIPKILPFIQRDLVLYDRAVQRFTGDMPAWLPVVLRGMWSVESPELRGVP